MNFDLDEMHEMLPMGTFKLCLKIDSMWVLLYHPYFKNKVYVKFDQSMKWGTIQPTCCQFLNLIY